MAFDTRPVPTAMLPDERQGSGLRDPFAWREALSPACSTPGSHSEASREGSTPSTPWLGPLSSSRSSRSSSSVRSGAGTGGGTGLPRPPSHESGLSARSKTSHLYDTPATSARSSGFASVCDTESRAGSARSSDFSFVDSRCGSARNSEFGVVHENELVRANLLSAYEAGSGGAVGSATKNTRRQHAIAAALDQFMPQAHESGAPDRPAVQPSVDPRRVFSWARHGKHKEVEAALKAGFGVGYVDSFGNSLFHIACQNGNKRIAKLAIKFGGDMGARNGRGNTGLHFLFAYGYPDVAEYFIEKGADADARNESGKAPREGIK